MEITKDLFEQRRAQFAQEREKLLQLLGGTAQGIAECDYWLAKLAESERPAEPAKE